MSMTSDTRYDSIGANYAATRQEEPRFMRLIEEALGDARTVVNVGAGTGSYEPRNRHVIAIEPSDVMATQRATDRVPAIRATAGSLPLRDQSVDAAMSVLSLHHWDAEQEAGVRELRRVARGPVVILTCDPEVSGRMWLMSDYLPEVAELDLRTFPSIESLLEWLGGEATVTTVPIPSDTCDWSLMSFWAHPERVLDPVARNATSGFARMSVDIVERAVESVRRDLASGVWDERYGGLRNLKTFDAGLRVIVGA